jgi:hypothetical protein
MVGDLLGFLATCGAAAESAMSGIRTQADEENMTG